MQPTVIISGGSSGIGKSCCKLFSSNHWRVFNLDITPSQSIDSQWIECDLTDTAAIKKALEIIKKEVEETSIECLIANAGKHVSANIENTNDALFYDVINTNLKSAFALIRETLPIMKSNGHGTIITIGSDQSIIAKPNSAAYGLTKAALAQLTKNIALDYAKYNITANCIAAGTIDTPLYQNAITSYSNRSGIPLDIIHQEEAQLQPLNRIGKASEVAELAYFLASRKAAYMTGAVLPFDGGYTAQ